MLFVNSNLVSRKVHIISYWYDFVTSYLLQFYFNPKYKKSIVIWEHDHLLSLAILSFAINSLAICFTFSQASHALRPHLLSSHLLSCLTCFQVHLLSVSTAINDHLLSKTSSYLNTLLSKLVVFRNKFFIKTSALSFLYSKCSKPMHTLTIVNPTV